MRRKTKILKKKKKTDQPVLNVKQCEKKKRAIAKEKQNTNTQCEQKSEDTESEYDPILT